MENTAANIKFDREANENLGDAFAQLSAWNVKPSRAVRAVCVLWALKGGKEMSTLRKAVYAVTDNDGVISYDDGTVYAPNGTIEL